MDLTEKNSVPEQQKINFSDMIFVIRGQRVMLDKVLATLYEVPTSRLNEAVKRHKNRFPEDFMFQLTEEEKKQARRGCRNLRYPPEFEIFKNSSVCFYRTRSCYARKRAEQ